MAETTSIADAVIHHLMQIAGGHCSITAEDIETAYESDPAFAEILMGLSHLHEDLEYRQEQRRAAEDELKTALHRVEEQNKTLNANVEALKRSEEKIRTSNHDLQQFAYVASHDLKAPLRAISNIASWIQDDIDDPENHDQVREHLARLITRTQRMSNLIDGVLSYSRLESTDANLTEVDCHQLLDELVQIDLAEHPGYVVKIAEQMPTLRANRVVLTQIFLNLITNAIKHHDRSSGTIEIDAKTIDEHTVRFSVRDDGPGIPESDRARVFAIFQTLKPRDQFESTGIGLSLVKKLVVAAGGRVWVESNGARGSCFHFTWPRAHSELGRAS